MNPSDTPAIDILIVQVDNGYIWKGKTQKRKFFASMCESVEAMKERLRAEFSPDVQLRFSCITSVDASQKGTSNSA